MKKLATTLAILIISGFMAPAARALDGKQLDDPARFRWVRSIVDRILDQTGWKRGQVKLTLLDSPEFNAFAGAENDVYVTKGLMDAVGSDDELAAVVSHEIVHVVRDHVKKNMQKQMITGGLVGILSTVSKNQKVATAGKIVGNLENLRFAREEESEADALGFQFFVKAGFAPAGFIEMLTKLTQKGTSPALLDFLSTHPNSATRLQLAKQRTAALPGEIQQRRPRFTGPGGPGGQAAPYASGDDIPTVSAPGFRAQSAGDDDIPVYNAGGGRTGPAPAGPTGGAVYDPYANPASGPARPPPRTSAPTGGEPSWRTIKLKNGKTIRVN